MIGYITFYLKWQFLSWYIPLTQNNGSMIYSWITLVDIFFQSVHNPCAKKWTEICLIIIFLARIKLSRLTKN